MPGQATDRQPGKQKATAESQKLALEHEAQKAGRGCGECFLLLVLPCDFALSGLHQALALAQFACRVCRPVKLVGSFGGGLAAVWEVSAEKAKFIKDRSILAASGT